MDKPSKRASEMQRVVEEFRASGLTRLEFARQRGIAVTTLDYWRQRVGPRPRLLKWKWREPKLQRRVSHFAWPTGARLRVRFRWPNKSWRD